MTLTGDASGTAVLVPCVSAILSVAGLVAEAAALWGAERAAEPSKSIGASWGSGGVLLATTVPAEWRAGWACLLPFTCLAPAARGRCRHASHHMASRYRRA